MTKQDKAPSFGAGSRGLVSLLVLVAVAVGLVANSRPRVAASFEELDRGAAVYAMPDAKQLLVFSLGYRSALADLLFGKTMVAAGVHFVEHRVFHHLDAYLKAILALEPRYYDVYVYADALLNLSTVEMPKENLRIARDILEEGLGQFPADPELWMNAGLFIAYMAPNRLPENEDEEEWRATGAKMVSRACDLWPEGRSLPGVCVSSTKLLREAGETEAAIVGLERLLAVTDDPQARARAVAQLEHLVGRRHARERQRAVQRLAELHRSDLPSTSRARYQILAPKTDPVTCAGVRAALEIPECASSFARLKEGEDPE